MKHFSEMTPAEKHATYMRNLWDAELMFLEYTDGNSEYWSRANRDILLADHQRKMEKAGLKSSAI